MSKKNKNLGEARKNKNDEFYTQIEDVEKEVKYYKNHFKGKTVFLNCDDPRWSDIWKYFELNFERLQLKRLISTHYEDSKPSYWQEIIKTKKGINKTFEIPLKGNGDFRSNESIELLKQSDIVVTNPPFSLFREYLAQLMQYNKKFLIIGSMNALSYKETFPLIKEGKLWLGINSVNKFKQPDGTFKKFGNICWYTNLEHPKRNEELISFQKFEDNNYEKYDNYDAINIDKVKDIPLDYKGEMGVPITFLTKYNPDQFEIINMSTMSGISANHWTYINGKPKYARLYIKRK